MVLPSAIYIAKRKRKMEDNRVERKMEDNRVVNRMVYWCKAVFLMSLYKVLHFIDVNAMAVVILVSTR